MTNRDFAKALTLTNQTLQLLKDLHGSRGRIQKSIQAIQVSIREMERVVKELVKNWHNSTNLPCRDYIKVKMPLKKG